MSEQLAAAQVAHVVIETDELDRVFPRPVIEELERTQPGATEVSSINLAAMWSARLAQREIGSGAEEQAQRSLQQAE